MILLHSGRAKILDFGLATTDHIAEPGDSTIMAVTAPLAIVGTVGYLSPEQVRNTAPTTRSDIFSLGAILYETLSGHRAFQCESPVETLNAILKVDPPPLPPGIPVGLQEIVFRCLAKNPSARFQSAADLAFTLRLFSKDLETPYPPTSAARHWSRRSATTAGLGALATGAAAYFVPRTVRPRNPKLRRLTFRRGFAYAGRFAPDGQVIVYDAQWEGGPPRLYSTRADSPESRTFDLAPARLQAISRRGEMLVILQDRQHARARLSGRRCSSRNGARHRIRGLASGRLFPRTRSPRWREAESRTARRKDYLSVQQ